MEPKKSFKKDKSDRATVEEVLDPRTKIILFKLINKGFIDELNGSISRGKEANVFYATSSKGEFAVKIYKTSIMTFKKRRKYVEGEFRFRKLNYSSNPRKLIKMWAEKEMRNLMRLVQCDVACPRPLFLKNNVLVMEFIGENGKAAKTLKNSDLNEKQARELYLDCVMMMRRMYNDCKLIHADFSEFNMLLYQNKLYIIDVSQSVEHDHPNAFDFLRSDCSNVNDFFRKKNVQTMTLKELFEFITDPNITESNIDLCLEKLQMIASQRSLTELTAQEKIEEEVFKQSYIPQRLDEVVYYERDINRDSDEKKTLYYQANTGMKADLSGPSKLPIILQSDTESESDEAADEASEGSDDEDEAKELAADVRGKRVTFKDKPEFRELCSDKENTSETDDSTADAEDEEDESGSEEVGRPSLRRDRNESTEEKKNRKKAFKEEKAEKRKTKIPKYIKKRNEKKKHRNTKK